MPNNSSARSFASARVFATSPMLLNAASQFAGASTPVRPFQPIERRLHQMHQALPPSFPLPSPPRGAPSRHRSPPARRAMFCATSGIFDFSASASARAGSAGTSGSIAYQYICGRLWSFASSACEISASAIAQRCSSGRRWSALARARRTLGSDRTSGAMTKRESSAQAVCGVPATAIRSGQHSDSHCVRSNF